ncbi:MAG: DUF2231 domain-containing protein [Phycisphaerae bacterium]
MEQSFISPNWHVLFIHFPLALLTLGVLIELANLIRPCERCRTTGRWMVMVGGLLSVITLTAGIYAFRGVVAPGALDPDLKWHTVLSQSLWSDAQWSLMKDHIWYNSIAVVIFLLVIVLWLGGSDQWRKKIYVPLLIALLVGMGLMFAGAWHGGEAVYRYGTAVNPGVLRAGQTLLSTPPGEPSTGILWYIQPLQLHLVLAGLTVAFVIAALGLTFRRWNESCDLPITSVSKTPSAFPIAEPVKDCCECACSPCIFWLLALLSGIGTALAGAWSVMDGFTVKAFKENMEMLQQADHHRLLLHVIAGVSIILLAIILAIVVHFSRKRCLLKDILIGILLLFVAFQLWLGILVLYDSHTGPLTGFNAVEQVQQPTTQATSNQPTSLPAPVAPNR